MPMKPCLNTERRVNRDVVLLEHRMLSQKEVLKHRVKMIWENASIMVACNIPLKTTRFPNSQEDIAPPHHHSISSIFDSWNQTVNMKCFCRCSTDEHIFSSRIM
ncbi:hypothetical protein TNCV_1666491 [Trichonephila clavipes]|nr:hypothetical protein TNCV_1666491 [Trichonephila clavipes]